MTPVEALNAGSSRVEYDIIDVRGSFWNRKGSLSVGEGVVVYRGEKAVFSNGDGRGKRKDVVVGEKIGGKLNDYPLYPSDSSVGSVPNVAYIGR